MHSVAARLQRDVAVVRQPGNDVRTRVCSSPRVSFSRVTNVVLIANPAAGRGAGARRIDVARAAFASVGVSDVRLTGSPGDEARLVRAALDDGAQTLAILGGDGTWGKCAAAVAALAADVRLVFLKGGTGNDFAKNLPAPVSDLAAMARLAVDGGAEWHVDMGVVECGPERDWFLNVAGFGFDVAVLEQLAAQGALSGPLVYVAAALRQLFGYRGFRVAVAGRDAVARSLMLVASNGLNFGGAFRIAPLAKVTDGLLDVVHVGDVRGLARLPLFASALRGTHLKHPAVTSERAASFTLRFDHPPAYEIDGELRRARDNEVTVRCVPGVLRVLAGPTLP